jgi:hypothetical protein
MADFTTSGCEQCRQGLRSVGEPQPRRLAPHPKWPLELLRCDVCGTFWESDPHHPTAVSEEYVLKEYPNVRITK